MLHYILAVSLYYDCVLNDKIDVHYLFVGVTFASLVFSGINQRQKQTNLSQEWCGQFFGNFYKSMLSLIPNSHN